MGYPPEKQSLGILILRWFAVLPASIASLALIVTLLWVIQRYFSWGEGAIANFLDTVWNGFLGGLAWVYAGAYTAPIANKLPISIVLLVLLALFVGAMFLGLIASPTPLEHGGVAAVLQMVMLMVGSGTAVYQLKDEQTN